MARSSEPAQLIIGLDFGTTFSGIAYSYTRDEQMYVIDQWPRVQNPSPKVETAISYDPETRKVKEWGASYSSRANSNSPFIRYLKLLLNPGQTSDKIQSYREGRVILAQLGKTAEDAASDFIGAIYAHAMNCIQDKLPARYLQRCEKKFVITIPAIWSEKERHATAEAARRAGIHPVQMVTEPEAAALYTLDTEYRALSPGDAFTVCDVGGGTTDLISYEVVAVEPVLQLAELIPSQGALCGSLDLDHKFVEVVRGLVGAQQFSRFRGTDEYKHTLNDMERIKRGFEGIPTDEKLITFPFASFRDNWSNGLIENCLRMPGTKLKEIFDPIVSRIIQLVDAHVDQIINQMQTEDNQLRFKAIFLVGGFGTNVYLRKRLKEAFPSEDIQVIQPPYAWSAIVKGAVLSQMPNKAVVTTNVARKHYGIAVLEDWNPQQDSGRPRIRSAGYKGDLVNKMKWFINKGERLTRGEKRRITCYCTWENPPTDEALLFEHDLLTSDAWRAPEYPDEDITPILVVLYCDLNDIDRSLITRERGQWKRAQPCWQLKYDLTMTTDAALFEFGMEINGQVVGRVDVQYIE